MTSGITIRSVDPPPIKPDAYQALVDGALAGVVRYSLPLELPLEPGVHIVTLKGPFFARSESLDFLLRPGQHLEFECGTDVERWYEPLVTLLLGTQAIWLRHSGVSV